MNRPAIKLCIREIKSSLSRYLAIFAIIALGTGLFMGLRMSRPDFMDTFSRYAEKYNFYDIRLVSTLGLTEDDLGEVRKVPGVLDAEGTISSDFLYNTDEEANLILLVQSIPERINTINLKAGRMPEKPDECLADPELFSEDDIGRVIKLSPDNSEATFDSFASDDYTVVGLCDSVLYINYERGSSTLGNGSVEGYLYIPIEGFSLDCFTDIYLTVDADGELYSEEYKQQIGEYKKPLEELLEQRAELRFVELLNTAIPQLTEAQELYEEGLAQYEPAKAEYDRGYAEFLSQRENTEKQLSEAEEQLKQAEEMGTPAAIAAKQAEIDAGRAELEAGQREYEQGVAEFETMQRLAYAPINAALESSENLMANAEAKIAEIDAEIAALQAELDDAERVVDRAGVRARILSAQGRRELREAEYSTAKGAYNSAMAQKADIDAQLQPYARQLADGKAQLDAGFAELNEGQRQLDELKRMLESGDLAAKRQELAQGRAEAEKGFAEAEAELRSAKAQLDSAKAELDDGKRQLDDAEKQIKNMENADTYVLGRDTNIGYVCFESDTEVVASIAGVFPVFFFLVAALVCLTTMTRMIDDERTQVGIMKALGYTPGEIMGKFLLYSGSSTLFGCIFGIGVGLFAFPAIVWFGYSLMYNISGLCFKMNWTAALILTLVNILGMLGVTWYCCARELRSVPGELIRPKAPEAGKRIFLEKFKALWNRLSFMQKVSARNIFRYKKRMLMIVIGVGGCTALVLTAFGLNDTIKHVVSGQYEEICHYDYELSMAYNMTGDEQDLFLDACGDSVADARFLYCGSADVSFNGVSKNVNISATDDFNFDSFIDFRDGNRTIEPPGKNEVIINQNLARMMDIEVGDVLEISNADMEQMEVTVTGIYDNYVNHWIFVSLETCTAQWGYTPELKSAYIVAPEGADVYDNAERIAEVDGVRSITLCADTRDRIENMLAGLAFVIAAIVACAGLLAFIVLYNLTNINISERIREIATIKVLGFYKNETAAYVFRENTVLTGMGALFGLLLGVLLHAFIMNRIKVDMLYFEPYIRPLSYFIAIALTFVFSFVVNRIMQRRIDGIDMAGALKSIE